jgi:hypothetical protein
MAFSNPRTDGKSPRIAEKSRPERAGVRGSCPSLRVFRSMRRRAHGGSGAEVAELKENARTRRREQNHLSLRACSSYPHAATQTDPYPEVVAFLARAGHAI